MSGSLKSRVKRVEQELALHDNSEVAPLLFMIVASREECQAVNRLPRNLPVQIPEGAIVNNSFQAADYLQWAREQFPELFEQGN